MHPREIGRRYDAIAATWDAHRRESSQGVSFLERAIDACKSGSTALDVGCGSGGQMLDKMIAAGFRVTGLDVSRSMLDIARARYPAVELVHDDITEWKPRSQFDLIVAWDSIFHLPHDSHAPVIEKLCATLAEGGVLLFTAGGIDGEIVGEMHDHEFGYSSLSDDTLIELVRRGGCVPILVERDQLPLEHLVVVATRSGPGAA